MLRTQLAAAVLVVNSLGICGFTCAQTEEYRDADRHFTLTLPTGWERMDDAALQQINLESRDPAGDTSSDFIVGFTPAEASEFPGARILVRVETLPMKGLTYEKVASQLKRDLAGHLDFIVENEKGPSKTPAIGEARFDRKRNRVVLRLPTDSTQLVSQNNYTVVMLGSEGMIAMSCHAADDEYKKATNDFRALTDSFRFDSGYEFKPAQAGADSWSLPRGVVRFGIFLAVGGGAAWWAWMNKKPKRREFTAPVFDRPLGGPTEPSDQGAAGPPPAPPRQA